MKIIAKKAVSTSSSPDIVDRDMDQFFRGESPDKMSDAAWLMKMKRKWSDADVLKKKGYNWINENKK